LKFLQNVIVILLDLMIKKLSEYLEENISQMVRVINMSYKISKSNFDMAKEILKKTRRT